MTVTLALLLGLYLGGAIVTGFAVSGPPLNRILSAIVWPTFAFWRG